MKNKKRLLKYFIQYVLDNDLSISELSTKKEIKRFLKHLSCMKIGVLKARINELESTLNNKVWRPGAIVKITRNVSKHSFDTNETVITISKIRSVRFGLGWNCCATNGVQKICFIAESEGEVIG
jgi:hypothetical protein